MQDLTLPLRDYQGIAAQWAMNRLYARDAIGAGLFLDPGLGKTRTSLTIADELLTLKEVKRVLIIAPLRPVYSVWPAEMKKWKFDMSWSILHEQYDKAMAWDTQLEIVNPEGVVKLQDLGGRWDLIIVDESTKFKSWSSRRMKFMRKLLAKTPKRLILSGTPAANSLADLHAQMYIIDNGESLGRTAGYFREMYMCRGGWQGKQWVVREDMKHALLDKISDRCLRMDAESYLDMPALLFNDIWVEMPEEAKRQYNKLKRELYVKLQTGDVFCGSAAAAYMKCKQFANGQVYNTDEESGVRTTHRAHDAKVEALVDLMEELAGKPLLISYQVTADLERLQMHKAFSKLPVIKGRMKAKDVDEIIAKWNRGEYKGLLAQCQTVSHGLNMQEACNDVGWFGLCDSPEVYDQFIRRIYRQGVVGPQVRVHRLLTRGTVDEPMLGRIESKGQTQAEFLEALKKHARA